MEFLSRADAEGPGQPVLRQFPFLGDAGAKTLIGTNDRRWQTCAFAVGSVIYDPWRIVGDQEGVDVHRLGQRNPRLPLLRQPAAH